MKQYPPIFEVAVNERQANVQFIFVKLHITTEITLFSESINVCEL